MKTIGKILFGIIETVVIAYTILITSCLIFVNEYGFTQLGNYTIIQATKGEEKTLENVAEGDLLIIKKGSTIKEGVVVYYYSVANDNYFIKQAPVKEIKDDGFGELYTLDIKDKSEINVINDKKLIGSEIAIHKNLGKVLDVLESRVGFLFLVLLPIMLIFIYHVYNFVIMLKYEKPDDSIEDDKEDKKVEKKEDKEEKKEVKEEKPKKEIEELFEEEE